MGKQVFTQEILRNIQEENGIITVDLILDALPTWSEKAIKGRLSNWRYRKVIDYKVEDGEFSEIFLLKSKQETKEEVSAGQRLKMDLYFRQVLALTLKTGTFSHSPSPNFECEELQYKKKALKSHQGDYTNIETEVKNMLADKLEAISTDLEEIQGSLTGVRNIIAKRAISRVLNDLDDVYNELTSTEYREQQETLKEQTERMKQRVVAEVIGELEEREESYYRNYWGDTKFIKLLSNFDGFLFLNTYLAEITKENTYPMEQSQLLNYVWEVIAVDIAKKKRGKKNVLDSWTDSSLYTRGMMID